jgi:spore maturation protein CgeB
MKKILHLALNNLRQNSLCDALATLGEYKEIDWIKEQHQDNFHQKVIDASKWADIVFMQLQTPGVITPELAKQMGGFRINWTGDVRQPLPQWYIDLGKEIDLSLFTNTADVQVMREHGCRADYLQTGFDHNIFRKIPMEKKYDIVFMGNHYHDTFPLSKLRYDMVHQLKATYGDRFHLFGMAWGLPSTNLMYNQEEENRVYNQSKIAINLSHFELPRYSSDRIQRIMGAGCFCLTHWYPEMKQDYSPLLNLDKWIDPIDLMRKIDHYLEYEEQREKIASTGYKLAHAKHTWHYRIKELKKLI